MTFRTIHDIHSEMQGIGLDIIATIKQWRAAKSDAKEPCGLSDFYKSRGACPRCGGRRTIYIHASGGDVIAPSITITDCPDHEDNRILEVAATSNSFLIVSDDTHLLDMSPWRGTSVVTSREFVTRTDAMRRGRR